MVELMRAHAGYSGEKSVVTLEHSFCSTQKERGKDRASNHKNAFGVSDVATATSCSTSTMVT